MQKVMNHLPWIVHLLCVGNMISPHWKLQFFRSTVVIKNSGIALPHSRVLDSNGGFGVPWYRLLAVVRNDSILPPRRWSTKPWAEPRVKLKISRQKSCHEEFMGKPPVMVHGSSMFKPFGSHYSRFLEHWKHCIVIGRSAANLADPRKHREVGKHKSSFVCLDLVIWIVRVTLITSSIHPWTEDVLPSVLDSTAISTCEVMDWLWSELIDPASSGQAKRRTPSGKTSCGTTSCQQKRHEDFVVASHWTTKWLKTSFLKNRYL